MTFLPLLKKFGKACLSNIELKIGAVVFSIILWLFAVNIGDPLVTTVFRGVPITFLNEEVITNQGKAFLPTQEELTVGVTIVARRSVSENIRSTNITVTADFVSMELNSLVPITVTVPGFEGQIQSATSTPNNVRVVIEDTARSTFPIAVNVIGNPSSGFIVGETTADPASLTVSGPESLVQSIDRAVVTVDASDLSATSLVPGQLTIYARDGSQVNQKMLTMDTPSDQFLVNLDLLQVRNLPINFNEDLVLPQGYHITSISSEPKFVQVAGSREALQGVSSLSIPVSELDFDVESGHSTLTVDVRQFIPEELRLVDDNASSIVVTMEIEEIGQRTIELPVQGIQLSNLAEGLTVSFASQELTLVFEGDAEALENLDLRGAASINMVNRGVGTYDMMVIINEFEGVTLLSEPRVRVTVSLNQSSTNGS